MFFFKDTIQLVFSIQFYNKSVAAHKGLNDLHLSALISRQTFQMNALVEMMGKKKKEKSWSLHTAKTNIDSNMYTPGKRNVWNEEGST